MVTDLQAARSRWGVGNLDGTAAKDSPEVTAWQERSLNSAAVGELGDYTLPMLQEWGWNTFDVQWEATLFGDRPVSVLKLRDDIDMAVVTDSLEQAYLVDGPPERPHYRFDRTTGASIMPFLEATVLPEHKLIVTGGAPEEVLAVFDGNAPSVASLPEEKPWAELTMTPEVMQVRTGGDACTDPVAGTLGQRASADQRAQLEQKLLDLQQLARPVTIVHALQDESTAVILAGYSDPQDAAADLHARRTLLTEGQSTQAERPYTDLLPTIDIAAEGKDLVYSVSGTGTARLTLQMSQTQDDPWAYCGTG
ncbi:hypothetical protein H4P1_00030 (plasmid) [Variovorax sp. PBS-H4]|uniref:hypothetical protein n=1 Tax=Variovorax sp. PBS-H4 TaxID=434008 RepID=UPI001316B696|nr:hypothetical protein [Variovorax sp. PBS-H4]VTU41398.1 hypothetical protein H4P1_00030 [Variovorax sp. PBS-H4]